ncbi:MAG: ArsR/SmtB family transcription factor [Candidatus Nanohaloarchaea archaeon]
MGNQRDYKKEILTSKLAFKILRKLHRNGESYPTEIAKELETSYDSVNNYMKGLRKRNLVQKSRKEGRKQLYKINTDSFFTLWLVLWKNLSKKDKTLSVSKERSDFIKNYISHYLDQVPTSSLNKMLIHDFISSLESVTGNPKYGETPFPTLNTPEWLRELEKNLHEIYFNRYKTGKIAMRLAIEELESEEPNLEEVAKRAQEKFNIDSKEDLDLKS